MEEEQRFAREPTTAPERECKHEDRVEDPEDPAGNGVSSLVQPLLKRSATLTAASHLALVGAKVSHIESLDYE
jgi:chloride channel 7